MKVGCMVLLLVFLATMIFVACTLEGSDFAVGSMKITLRDEINARTIVPNLDMEADTYQVSVSRVGSTTMIGPIEMTESSYVFKGIQVGEWIVTVEAYNNDTPPVKIGEGSSLVTITRGITTATSVPIVPLKGKGDFNFTIECKDTVIDSLQVEAFLTSEDNSTETPINVADIAISGSLVTITVEDLDVGYYDFSYILKDGTTPFGGNFHEVRIVKDQTSFASEVIQGSPLGISVSVINNLHNPFEVTISSEDEFMERRSIQAFTASPAKDAMFQWYLDGVKIAGGNEATYQVDGEGMAFGWHNLSVKVKKAEGWYSSGTFPFYMDEAAGNGGLIELTFTNKADPDDVWNLRLTSGPAQDTGFNSMAVFSDYNIPIHLEFVLEKSHANFLPGSFMCASSVPLDIDDHLNMFPKDGDENDEVIVTGLGAWEVDFDTVELDHPYSECLFMAFMIDENGYRKSFDAIDNFNNVPLGDGTFRWGAWNTLRELAGEGVFITFTKYGEDPGSYVKGTISGTALSPIPDPVNPNNDDLDTLGFYTVTGSFTTTRAVAIK